MDIVPTSQARIRDGKGLPWDVDDPTSDDEPRPSLDEMARALHARAVARAESWRGRSD
jgi:hypothetical protein